MLHKSDFSGTGNVFRVFDALMHSNERETQTLEKSHEIYHLFSINSFLLKGKRNAARTFFSGSQNVIHGSRTSVLRRTGKTGRGNRANKELGAVHKLLQISQIFRF